MNVIRRPAIAIAALLNVVSRMNMAYLKVLNARVFETLAEIGREPIERTILGKPVVLYRTLSGSPVAMYGICPHRYYPLALGKLDGDAIVCGYHGFTFDADGKCIRIPAQDTGAAFCQPVYRIELESCRISDHHHSGLLLVFIRILDKADFSGRSRFWSG